MTTLKPGTIELKQMAVTQFVSVLLYASVFATIWLRADFAADGFGRLSGRFFSSYVTPFDPSAIVVVKLFILIGIVAANAIRYHLSFWSVEENRGFHALCEWADKNNHHWLPRIDLFLRVSSYIVLFMLQLACTTKGATPEGLLVCLFGLLVTWDLVMLRLAHLHEVGTPTATTGMEVVRSFITGRSLVAFVRYWRASWRNAETEDDVKSFRCDVCHWLLLEAVGLICMVVYFVWASTGASQQLFTSLMLVAVIGGVSMVLAMIDVFRNWNKYRRIIPPLVLYGACLLVAMKWLGLLQ